MPRRIVFAAVRLRSHHLFLAMLGILLLEGAVLGVLPPPGLRPVEQETAIQLPPLTSPALAEGEAPPPARVGAKAPNFTLPTLDGGSVSLDAYRGRPVVLYVWASWCKYCQAHMGELLNMVKPYGAQGLALLTINLLEQPETARRFAQSHGLPPPVLLDTDGRFARQYEVMATPTAYFIDRQGLLRAKVVGWDAARLAALLRQIAEAPPEPSTAGPRQPPPSG